MPEIHTPDILSRLGISQLSEMQRNAVSVITANADTVLLAPTGTGKTLAFLLPLVSALDSEKAEPQALVLSPTRELAEQTFSVFTRMGTPLRACCLHGGRPAMDEHRQLNNIQPQLIVGTPGRINDHLDKGNFAADGIRMLVIDEFDKMLELKFQDELGRIVRRLTGVRRSVLVSATDAPEIPAFMGLTRRRPVVLDYLSPSSSRQKARITHYIVRSPQRDKLETLRMLLSKFGQQQAVVFVGYRESVDRVGQFLRGQGYSVSLFHGGMEQRERERSLYLFAGGAANVLVSTDLSARGLDIPTLRHVVHYHQPARPEDYLHRCGRTGRWDQNGDSYLILAPGETEPQYEGVDFEEYDLRPPYAPPAPSKWASVYIGKGRKDKLSKGDVVGFLCKQGGARRDDIGRIDMGEHWAYVAVLRSRVRQIISQCQGEKIKKLSTKIELMKP